VEWLDISKVSPGRDTSTDPGPIPPDSTRQIEVVLDTSGLTGRIEQALLIETNDPRKPIIRLLARARIRSAWLSTAELDFGTLRASEPAEKLLFVFFVAEDKGRTAGIETDRAPLSFDVKPANLDASSRRAADRAEAIILSAHVEGLEPGPYAFSPVVKTNVRGFEELKLRIRFHVCGRAVAVPSTVFFGALPPGGTVARICEVRPGEGEKIDLTAVRFVPDRTEITVAKLPLTRADRVCEILLTAEPDAASATNSLVQGCVRGYLGQELVLSIPYTMYIATF
jgi:hypothetical protein